MKKYLFVFTLLSITSVFGQKKVIDPSVYKEWKKNENQLVSNNGQFIAYEINPLQGDGFLYLFRVKENQLDSFPRGKEAKFSSESDYLAFKITPGFDTLRNCELNKIDKKKWPKDSLGIYLFEKDSLIKIPLLKSFTVGEENNWLSYLVDENEWKNSKEEASNTKKPKKEKHPTNKDLLFSSSDEVSEGAGLDCKKKKKKSEEKTDYKSDGKILTITNPMIDKHYQYKDIVDHAWNESGTILAMVEHKKNKIDSNQLCIVDLSSGKKIDVLSAYTSVKTLTFDKKGQTLAFLTSTDTAKMKSYRLNLYQIDKKMNKVLIDTAGSIIPSDRSVSENRKLLFTDDERFLFFGVADRPEPEKKDTLLESEKVEVDVWNYLDKRLQSQQLVELKRDQKKTDLYCYNLKIGNVLLISNDTLKMQPSENLLGNYLFATSDEQYVQENQWEVPNREDHYRISLLTGQPELIKKGVGFNGILSPNGNYYSYFDETSKQFYLRDLNAAKEICMTCSQTKVNWQSDVNGMPMIAEPFGVKGYFAQESGLLLQSEFDLWKFDIASSKLSCLTNGEGEQRGIRLEPKLWSSDSVYIDFSNVYVEGFNEKTKGTHFFELIDHVDHIDLKEIYYSDHKFSLMARSKNRETIIFRKMSLQDYPEVSFTRTNFIKEEIISSTNPQQKDYNWATVELVKWKSYDGIPLEGLLYKPENFDPSKKYPLLVYFYELSSDQFHSYYSPKPTASIIYPTEYASAGYIVFIPDVRYKTGYPARSAYNCIMSGTDHVLKLVPAIDSTRMGLQGQSWGGYQTAQLITMTNRYAAAMAGAPVADMFSAYGGIRWSTGVNRQFQYERTQSRIGKTIWDAPELYTENSPLFHLPNVKTPLLIMANDKDGAVPWYQGIELFTGMKRLSKPCWMLNYNGDDHNLMENANRMDLSIRMRQFFDHYLLNQPAPKWMTEGIPAIKKGKELGYK